MEQICETIMYYLTQMVSMGLMLAVFIDAFGVPFPGSLMIIMSGFLINRGSLELFEVILAILVGYLSGATTAYFIGKNFGQAFLEKYGRYVSITPAKLKRGQHWIEKSSAVFLIAGRMLPTIGNITPYIAGMSRIKFLYFFIYTFVFILLWGSVNIILGFVFSHSWKQVGELVGSKSWIFGLAIILIYLGYKYYMLKK